MSLELNEKAPYFEIEDFKGKMFKTSDYQGKKNMLIVLNRGFV